MADRDIVKQWFETGDKPTQAQFHQLFDKLRFKDEAIAVADIDDLVDLLQEKALASSLNAFEQGERVEVDADFSYDIPEGYLLEKIVVLPGTDATIKIGNDFAGDDICGEIEVTEEKGEVLLLNLYAKASRVIYFGGMNPGSAVIFFKRLVKA
jgi:hypothetical protein